MYSKTSVKRPLSKRPKLVLMQVKSIAEMEHSAILSTFIKLPVAIKTFVLSIFNGRFTQFTVFACLYVHRLD